MEARQLDWGRPDVGDGHYDAHWEQDGFELDATLLSDEAPNDPGRPYILRVRASKTGVELGSAYCGSVDFVGQFDGTLTEEEREYLDQLAEDTASDAIHYATTVLEGLQEPPTEKELILEMLREEHRMWAKQAGGRTHNEDCSDVARNVLRHMIEGIEKGEHLEIAVDNG